MSGYGLFQPATLGMKSQTHKLNTISYNIANINTGGFKRTDTEFETVLSDNFFQQKDIGGVKPYSRATNDVQGLVQQSNRNLDLAIVGSGFFSVRPDLNATTPLYFTRDGAFEINTVEGDTSSVTADDGSTITVSNGYLVDKNGFFLLGVSANADGTFTLGSAAPMRVDQYAFTQLGQGTTAAQLDLNLPVNDQFGDDSRTFTMRTYDNNGTERNISFNFSKSLTDNQWRIDYQADSLSTGDLTPSAAFSLSVGGAGGNELTFNAGSNTFEVVNQATGIPVAGSFSGLAVGDQITLADTASNNATYTISEITNGGAGIKVTSGLVAEANTGANAITITSTANLTNALVFSERGQLQSPTSLNFAATWNDGGTSNFSLDISGMTQFAGDFTIFQSGQDGYGKADLTDVSFDSEGHVLGSFSDGTQRAIYKVPLYDFTNPNGLATRNGMLFSESTESGAASGFFADESSKAILQPNAHEISNVDLAQQFTLMIQTQNAYNMNATSFRTIDEMTTVARDLKS